MEPRRLNTQVTLKSPATAQDDAGQPTGDPTTVATIWADIRHLSGLEAVKAGADTGIVKASIRIRFREGVTSAMEVVSGSTTYRITAVLPDSQRRWIDLAAEVVN